jgi:hypothetical protein
MKRLALLLRIIITFLLIGETTPAQTKNEIPKYEYKVEGDWILGPTLKWPLKGSDGSLWPSREGGKLVKNRWTEGAEAKLPPADTEAIEKVVFDKLPKDKRKMGAVKKISEREYMVYASWYSGPRAPGGLHFVVVNSGNGWIVIAHYYDWIS